MVTYATSGRELSFDSCDAPADKREPRKEQTPGEPSGLLLLLLVTGEERDVTTLVTLFEHRTRQPSPHCRPRATAVGTAAGGSR